MQGLGTDGTPHSDPNGIITTFMYSGDPVSGTGWLDTYPGDRYFLLSSGPFDFAAGDTQTIVGAKIAAWRNSNIGSVAELKVMSSLIQNFYDGAIKDNFFHNLNIEKQYTNINQTDILVSVRAAKNVSSIRAILKDASDNILNSFDLYDDGQHDDELAGDGIFAASLTVQPKREPLYIGLQLKSEMLTYEYDRLDRISTAGPIKISGLKVVSDHLNQDGKINPGENIRLSADVWNGSHIDFNDVTALFTIRGPLDSQTEIYQIFGDIGRMSAKLDNYTPGDPNTYTQFQLSSEANTGDTIQARIVIKDALGNSWQDTRALIIEDFSFSPGDLIEIDHAAGKGDGRFYYRIVDPVNITDHSYEIHITEPENTSVSYTFDFIDLTTAETLLVNNCLPDEFSHHIPLIHGFRLYGEDFGIEIPMTFHSAWQSVNADSTEPGLSELGDLSDFNKISALPENIRQRDIELRFTGVADTDDWFGVVISGGSMGTQWDKSAIWKENVSNCAHTPIRLPFEVWDVENDRQINCAVFNYNRDNAAPYSNGVGDPNTPGMEPRWRITGRDVFNPIFTDYDETVIHSPSDSLSSWLFCFIEYKGATWTTGDVFKIKFLNKLSSYDIYRFNPEIVSVDGEADHVQGFELHQNYPNPFNPRTIIHFRTLSKGHVELDIYNMLGQHVLTLINTMLAKGSYSVIWDATDKYGINLSSGIYFYKLKTKNNTKTHKMILLR